MDGLISLGKSQKKLYVKFLRFPNKTFTWLARQFSLILDRSLHVLANKNELIVTNINCLYDCISFFLLDIL